MVDISDRYTVSVNDAVATGVVL